MILQSPAGQRLARSATALSDTTAWAPAIGAFAYWMRRYRRTWRGSVVISVVNPLLFLAALGIGLGRLVDAHQSIHLPDVAYVDFLAPGLLTASAMQNAFVEATYPVHEATRTRGAYPSAAATPLRPGDILAGHLMFMAFRITISALAFVLVLIVFGVVDAATGALLVPSVLLVGMAFAAPLCAWAVGVERPSRLNGAYRFVAMPLYLFSGTFFAIGQLPGWLESLITLTPLYHGTELVRGIALGSIGPGKATAHAGYLVALALTGVVLARRGYSRRLHH